MLNWPIFLNQKAQADSCNITEIVGIKRNEVENKERLKRPLERIRSHAVEMLKNGYKFKERGENLKVLGIFW